MGSCRSTSGPCAFTRRYGCSSSDQSHVVGMHRMHESANQLQTGLHCRAPTCHWHRITWQCSPVGEGHLERNRLSLVLLMATTVVTMTTTMTAMCNLLVNTLALMFCVRSFAIAAAMLCVFCWQPVAWCVMRAVNVATTTNIAQCCSSQLLAARNHVGMCSLAAVLVQSNV